MRRYNVRTLVVGRRRTGNIIDAETRRSVALKTGGKTNGRQRDNDFIAFRIWRAGRACYLYNNVIVIITDYLEETPSRRDREHGRGLKITVIPGRFGIRRRRNVHIQRILLSRERIETIECVRREDGENRHCRFRGAGEFVEIVFNTKSARALPVPDLTYMHSSVGGKRTPNNRPTTTVIIVKKKRVVQYGNEIEKFSETPEAAMAEPHSSSYNVACAKLVNG